MALSSAIWSFAGWRGRRGVDARSKRHEMGIICTIDLKGIGAVACGHDHEGFLALLRH
jgi:hypothetical protein